MKQIALISLVAFAALVSCRKETLTEETQTVGEPLVFTASISSDGTKTTLSDDKPAKILWESTDKITISDKSGHTAIYKLSKGAGTKSGTFIKDSGDDLDNPGTYTATYGAEPSTYQIYSSAGSVPLYMTAPETSDADGLVFTARCGVLRVTLNDAEHDIMRVEVSDGINTYKLTSTSEVNIFDSTYFYLALPAGTYTALNIYDNDWHMVSKTFPMVVTEGHLKPVVKKKAMLFTNCTTKGFRGTHAAVQLWADGPFWAETNIGADTPQDCGRYFAWGYPTGYSWTGSAWSPSITFDTDGFPDYKTHIYEDMASANWGSGWSVPTADQLDILVNYDHSTQSACHYGKCSVTPVNEGGMKGIGITGTTSGYTSNSIFLPAAAIGVDSILDDEGSCYWSSVQDHISSAYALIFDFYLDEILVSEDINKYYGISVRPVRSSL